MKLRNNYVLCVNPMLGKAYYGNGKFNTIISECALDKIFGCIFGWNKWELVVENAPQIKDVYTSPILGSYLINSNRMLMDIYKSENKRSGKVKYKKVIKK